MQTVVRSNNGMVQLSFPHEAGKNGVNESMASRLAALTKALKDKMPKNGTLTTLPVKSREMKTEAKPSYINGATVGSSNGLNTKDTSSVYVTRHCSDLLKKTTSRLSGTQAVIEDRVSKSLHALRHHQLALSHSHSSRQIGCQHSTPSLDTTRSHELENLSSEATPPTGSPSGVSNCSSMDSGSVSPSCRPDSSSHESLGVSSYSIQKHVQALRSFLDDDMTCSSSDEEEDDNVLKSKRYVRRPKSTTVKQRWEKDRAHIGSKWAWLCHQITSVNQKIYQLDSLLQSAQPKDNVQFASHLPFSASCVYGTQQQQQIKQIILSNPNLMAQQSTQIKDLIEFSLPTLLMEQSNQTCARTRMMKHAPKRKLIRARKDQMKYKEFRIGKSIDPSYHTFLSQPTDLSSSVWLDKAVHQILQEHSYASLPAQKKRKLIPQPTAVMDPAHSRISSTLRLERSKSFSPSPATPLDLSIERIGKGIPKKRNSASTNLNSLSDDSTNVTTPTLPRKRRSINTPQYDIDNIIIPYSMASSTRLEKLEYKEILTPRWQEKLYATANKNGVREVLDDEDMSDAAFQARHAKYEEKEKSRYLNFMGVSNGGGVGSVSALHGGRKRSRGNRSSTPELSHFQPVVSSDVISNESPLSTKWTVVNGNGTTEGDDSLSAHHHPSGLVLKLSKRV